MRCNIAVYVALVSIDQDIIHANVNRKSTGRSSMYDMKSLMTRIKVVFYFDIYDKMLSLVLHVGKSRKIHNPRMLIRFALLAIPS